MLYINPSPVGKATRTYVLNKLLGHPDYIVDHTGQAEMLPILYMPTVLQRAPCKQPICTAPPFRDMYITFSEILRSALFLFNFNKK